MNERIQALIWAIDCAKLAPVFPIAEYIVAVAEQFAAFLEGKAPKEGVVVFDDGIPLDAMNNSQEKNRATGALYP